MMRKITRRDIMPNIVAETGFCSTSANEVSNSVVKEENIVSVVYRLLQALATFGPDKEIGCLFGLIFGMYLTAEQTFVILLCV
jgi:hypothetical protein